VAPKPAGATTKIVSEVNRTTLLEALQATGPMTIQQLRQATGLSLATINRIIDRLRVEGLIIEQGMASSSGGRPPRLLAYNGRRSSVIATDIGGRTITGGIFDLHGQLLYQLTTETHKDGASTADSSKVFERVAGLIETLIAEADRLDSPARAVGIGVPGTVRSDTGLVQFAPSLHWWDLPLAGLLQERLSLPVVVENDVNLIAVGEHRFGVSRGSRDVITIAIGTGLGAGLIINSSLYRGAQGGAGEIGYALMEPSSLDQPWPGYGDLESRISGPAMARRAAAELSFSATGDSPEEFLERLDHGNPVATTLFTKLMNETAQAIANAAVLLNPELVVLAGGLGTRIGEAAIPIIETRLRGRIPMVPRFAVAEVDHVELVGAAQMAIDLTRNRSYLTH